MERHILNSSLLLIFAQGISKFISFFYVLFLANLLNIVDFGLYNVSLAYYSMLVAIVDFNISKYVIREVAQENDKSKVVLPVILIRLTATIILLFLLFIFLGIYDLNSDRKLYVVLLSLALIPQSFSVVFDSVLIAKSKIKISATLLFAINLITVIIGTIFVLFLHNALGAILAILVGQLLYSFFLFIATNKLFEGLSLGINLSSIMSIVKNLSPYSLIAVMGIVYFRADLILISYLRNNYEAGIYGMAYKFIEAVIFIPNTVSIVLLPLLSKINFFKKESEGKKIIIITLFLGLLGVIITIIYIFILPSVINSYFAKFTASLEPLFILSLTLPVLFIYIPLSSIFLSKSLYLKELIIISLFPLLFNLITNIIFIPQYGYIAAAWVTLISDILSFILIIYLVIRRYKLLNEK